MKPITSDDDIKDGLAALLSNHPDLRPIADQVPHVPLRLRQPGFEGLANIIVSQQVSKASAAAIFGRLQKTIVPLDATTYLAAGEAVHIKAGLSRAKQASLDAIANAACAGTLDIAGLCSLEADEAFAQLTAIRGIGPWTAEVFLLFCAGHPDIFPAGDVALQHAVSVALGHNERLPEKRIRELAQNWSPHRGIAARLFWAYYAVLKAGKEGQPF